jgi:hypothetical protein
LEAALRAPNIHFQLDKHHGQENRAVIVLPEKSVQMLKEFVHAHMPSLDKGCGS